MLWNKGFDVSLVPIQFLIAVLAIAGLYYLLIPLSKIILLPLNFISFGLVSIAFNSLLFYLIISRFSGIISIKGWQAPHVQLLSLNAGPAEINAFWNIVLCSIVMYVVINLLEKLL